jgi:hypothetical protein
MKSFQSQDQHNPLSLHLPAAQSILDLFVGKILMLNKKAKMTRAVKVNTPPVITPNHTLVYNLDGKITI